MTHRFFSMVTGQLNFYRHRDYRQVANTMNIVNIIRKCGTKWIKLKISEHSNFHMEAAKNEMQ